MSNEYNQLLKELEDEFKQPETLPPSESATSNQPNQETHANSDKVISGLTMARQALGNNDDPNLAGLIDAAIEFRRMASTLARVRAAL